MQTEQVVPSIADEASGPTYVLRQLCRALAEKGVQTRLHVTGNPPSDPDPLFPIVAYPRWRFLHRLGVSPRMRPALREAARTADIMHNHSLWMCPNVYPEQAVRGTRCKLVVSPHGTLNARALQRSRLVKWLMWWIGGQRRVLQRAHAFHATATLELEAIRQQGFRQPVAIIPNGVDVGDAVAPIAERNKRDRPLRRLIYLGRLHQQKGLISLIDAWAQVQASFPGWEVQIIGPDQLGHRAELERHIVATRVPRLKLCGPAYGDAKTVAYQEADLLILPTMFENFGMVVAEALAHGVPVIVTVGAPWEGLRDHRCGWWIERGTPAIAAALQTALASPPAELAAMGLRGREWMQREFSWESVAERMIAFYSWLLDGGDCPSYVHTA